MIPKTPDQLARRRAATLSLGVGVLMLVLKMGAYLLTGSAVILSDALESVVHVVATGFMFWCFRLSETPPDEDHPYGHGRAEPLSIGFEGGMVALAGLAIAWQAIAGLWQAKAPEDLGIGLWLIGAAALINLALGLHLVRTGRRTSSAILVADGQHVLSDVWTSIGVVVGVGLMILIPDHRVRVWLDGAIALLLAGYIVWVASQLIRESFAALLDEADPKLLERIVTAIGEIRDPRWIDVHQLRCRTAGDRVFVDFHLTVPGDWTVREGHDAVELLEHHVLEQLGRPGAVLIHLDYHERVGGEPTPLSVAVATAPPRPPAGP
jgi:cation diffusion facilitator family transporter